VLRRALDGLYVASAGLASLCLFGIFVMMMAQVGMREAGLQLVGADDLTAYLCVATAFFALAHTFRRGELIRVNMVFALVGPAGKRLLEGLALTLAAIVVGTMVWYTAADVLFSYEIEDVAQGTIAFPLWLPKLVMPIGAGTLLIAILDEAVRVLRGQIPNYVLEAEARAARGDFSAEV